MAQLSRALTAVTAALHDLHAQQLATKGTARASFRHEVAEALTNWRLGCIRTKHVNDAAIMLFREGFADIVQFRLRIAYMPLFQSLERIEKRVGILAELRREPWAPANHEVNKNGQR